MKQPEKYFIVTQNEVDGDELVWRTVSFNTVQNFDKEDWYLAGPGDAIYVYKLHTILKSRPSSTEEDDSPTIIYKD